jgi:omega-amidase
MPSGIVRRAERPAVTPGRRAQRTPADLRACWGSLRSPPAYVRIRQAGPQGLECPTAIVDTECPFRLAAAAMNDLRVSLVQSATLWHNSPGNRDMLSGLCLPLAGQTDLVILPETFTSGFTNETLVNAEAMDGPTLVWMRDLASRLQAVVTGSVVMRDGDRFFNRLLWAQPDGNVAHYDKRHLFRMAGEHQRYAGGEQRLIVELKGWRVCPMVCYDLRFPVWIRNRFNHTVADRFDYDLLIFVANWPSPRRGPWRTLLRARAIENLCCVAGLNRVGTDGNDLHYAGDSAIIDQVGETLIELGAEVQVATGTLSAAALLSHRERFPAWMDADQFDLR